MSARPSDPCGALCPLGLLAAYYSCELERGHHDLHFAVRPGVGGSQWSDGPGCRPVAGASHVGPPHTPDERAAFALAREALAAVDADKETP